MRTTGKLIVAGVFVFAVLQVVRPSIPVKPATAELQIPPDVKDILEKDCYRKCFRYMSCAMIRAMWLRPALWKIGPIRRGSIWFLFETSQA